MSSLVRKILFELGADDAKQPQQRQQEQQRLHGDPTGRSALFKARSSDIGSRRRRLREQQQLQHRSSRSQLVDKTRAGLEEQHEEESSARDAENEKNDDERGGTESHESKGTEMSRKRADRMRRLLLFKEAKRERKEQERNSRKAPFKVGVYTNPQGFDTGGRRGMQRANSTQSVNFATATRGSGVLTRSQANSSGLGSKQLSTMSLTSMKSGESRDNVENVCSEAEVTTEATAVVESESGQVDRSTTAVPEVLIESTASLGLSEDLREQARRFHQLLNDEKERLTSLCSLFEAELEARGDLPDTTQEKIRVTVGKAHLLMNQKGRFTQFFNLIQDFELQRGQRVPKPTDLQGFWELISIQSEDVKDCFSELQALKSNDWKQNTTSPVASRSSVKSPLNKKTDHEQAMKNRIEAAAKPSASLKALIMAKRKAKKAPQKTPEVHVSDKDASDETEKLFDGGFFAVQSPIRKSEGRSRVKTTPKSSLDVPSPACVDN